MNIERPQNLKFEKDGATDTEVAMILIEHIENPCETEVAPGGIKMNIRDFYIREAKNALKTMTNSHAKEALEAKIREYGEK